MSYTQPNSIEYNTSIHSLSNICFQFIHRLYCIVNIPHRLGVKADGMRRTEVSQSVVVYFRLKIKSHKMHCGCPIKSHKNNK